jgi:hypothetical protein
MHEALLKHGTVATEGGEGLVGVREGAVGVAELPLPDHRQTL